MYNGQGRRERSIGGPLKIKLKNLKLEEMNVVSKV